MFKSVNIQFKTITPLWTGDAWQNNSEIRPSSLMGSLRFWFEVICYFSGICKENDFNKKLGRFEKEVDRKELKKCLLKEYLIERNNTFEAKIECLLKQNIPLPSIIFGTTNLGSLMEIKGVKIINEFQNYKFPIGKISFPELKHHNKIPVWYFKKGFYGEFQVILKVEEKIIESIFYPLLTFMDKYGFWGGKWNIGYGRLKVLEVKVNNSSLDNWSTEEFTFKEINAKYKNKKFEDFIKNDISNLNDLVQKENKIQILTTDNSNNSLTEILKELIKTKTQKRAEFNTNTEERHKIFGTTKVPPNDKNLLPQGSKILPFIYEEQGQLKGNFLSIAGLLNLEGGSDE